MHCYVYLTTNLVNSKRYVGQSTKSGRAWDEYLGSGTVFRRALRKYGRSSFKKEILFEGFLTKQELNNLETKYIRELHPEYNIATRGGGGNQGEECNRRISEAKKGKPIHPNSHSPEAIAKRVAKVRGQKRSAETRQKLAKALEKARAAKVQPPWNKGKEIPEELKAKYRAAKLGTHQSEETKTKRKLQLTGRVAIHNPITHELRFLQSEDSELQSLLDQGWNLGREKFDSARRRVSGYVGIFNSSLEQNRNVPKEDVELFLSQGWELGRRNF